MLHPRNKPRADWLAQRGGCCDRRGAGLIPRGIKIFCCLGFSWDCMALCGAVAGPAIFAVRAHVFDVALAGRFAAPCFHDFCSVDVFALAFSLEVFGAAPCFRLGRRLGPYIYTPGRIATQTKHPHKWPSI